MFPRTALRASRDRKIADLSRHRGRATGVTALVASGNVDIAELNAGSESGVGGRSLSGWGVEASVFVVGNAGASALGWPPRFPALNLTPALPSSVLARMFLTLRVIRCGGRTFRRCRHVRISFAGQEASDAPTAQVRLVEQAHPGRGEAHQPCPSCVYRSES